MDTASINGKMEPYTRANGRIIKPMAKVPFGIQAVIYIEANFKMIKRMGLGFILIKMAASIKETGYMTLKRDREKKYGLMELHMLGTIRMG